MMPGVEAGIDGDAELRATVTELVQIVGTDVEQVLPSIVGRRALLMLVAWLKPQMPPALPGPDVQLGRLADADLEALEARVR
jgi:hypothetical protein